MCTSKINDKETSYNERGDDEESSSKRNWEV